MTNIMHRNESTRRDYWQYEFWGLSATILIGATIIGTVTGAGEYIKNRNVEKVRLADVNKDGLEDVLIELSDGIVVPFIATRGEDRKINYFALPRDLAPNDFRIKPFLYKDNKLICNE